MTIAYSLETMTSNHVDSILAIEQGRSLLESTIFGLDNIYIWCDDLAKMRRRNGSLSVERLTEVHKDHFEGDPAAIHDLESNVNINTDHIAFKTGKQKKSSRSISRRWHLKPVSILSFRISKSGTAYPE